MLCQSCRCTITPEMFRLDYAIATPLIAGLLCCPLRMLKAQPTPAGKTLLSPTPPMGWNSWDSYGLRINEQQFRDNVEVLAAKLKPFGYEYAIIDEGWYIVNPEDRPKPGLLKYELDENGRFIPVATRFPSALETGRNTGFEQIANRVHSHGLKFGIHVVRGIPRESVSRNLPIEGTEFKAQDAADPNDACPWDPTSWGVRDNAAGQAWYDSLLRQYARWGVDFLKVDCIADHPYKASEIRQIALAIRRSGRGIVLSLSPGPTALEHHSEVAGLSQMWRISNDIWDIWEGREFPIGIRNQFENAARWAPYTRPGNWPDADMLPVGELRPFPDVGPGSRHTRLTLAEQQTLLSLWAMARSPLIVGANLTLLDQDTMRLLTSTDILRIDQTATASRQVLREGDLVVWTADLPANEHALAAFNLGEKPITLNRAYRDFVQPGREYKIKNAWTGERLGASQRFSNTLEPHACTVLILSGNG
jgi:alpha-galactosidase